MHIDEGRRPSTEHLLSGSVEMQSISPPQHIPGAKSDANNSHRAHGTVTEISGPADQRHLDTSRRLNADEHHDASTGYRVYKRRFFGLAQLVLLNIIVSWDWLTFSAVSTTSSEYFGVSESAINWLSTGFLFAFVVISPLVMYTLNKGGPKVAIVTASVLVLAGNWIRYAGTRATGGHFGVVMFGQIIIGFAQPFVLSAPTRYSNLWFSDNGRVSATAVASLANPLGAAIGQLVGPFWATDASSIPTMVLTPP